MRHIDSLAAAEAATDAMRHAEQMILRYRTALEMIAEIPTAEWARGESAETMLRTARGYALGALGVFDNGVSISADGTRRGL